MRHAQARCQSRPDAWEESACGVSDLRNGCAADAETRPDRERLIALFLLGVLVFAPPLLLIFNTEPDSRYPGALLLSVCSLGGADRACGARGRAQDEDDESGAELTGREERQVPGEPTDA